MTSQSLWPAAPEAHRERVGEIDLRKQIFSRWEDARRGVFLARLAANGENYGESDCLTAADVAALVAKEEQRGVRALLVRLKSLGGVTTESERIVDVLRDFSARVGPVVVFIEGYTASAATLVALAGDFILMKRVTHLGFHSVVGVPAEVARPLNAKHAEYVLGRTLVPRLLIEEWVSRGGEDGNLDEVTVLTADMAHNYGMVDMIVDDLETARNVALSMVRSGGATSPRIRALRARASSVESSPASMIAAQTVVDSSSTRAAAVHNMWPNGSSEASPPSGANPATAEWVAIAGSATSFAGNFVRQVSATENQRVVFGDDPDPSFFPVSALIGHTAIGLVVPCSPGEAFAFEAQTRATAGGAGGLSGATEIDFLDKAKAGLGSGGSSTAVSLTVGGAWAKARCAPVVAPTGACYVYFAVRVDNGNATPASVQFDAIVAYRYTEASSDAATVSSSGLTIAAGGNTFTDVPGTSQSFTPLSDTRRIKVSVAMSGFMAGAAGALQARVVFGGTPTQAGSAIHFGLNTVGVHIGLPFMWAFPPATFGPVGTPVTVKLQIESPAGSAAGFSQNADDYATMVIEEIG